MCVHVRRGMKLLAAFTVTEILLRASQPGMGRRVRQGKACLFGCANLGYCYA